MGARPARRARSGRRSGPTSARGSSACIAHRRGHLGRGAAAVPRAQRLPRGDLPHVLLQPAHRRRRRDRRHAVRGQRGHRAGHRRAPAGHRCATSARTPTALRSEAEVLGRRGRHLAADPRSLPFALTYLFDDDGTAAPRRCASRHRRPGTPAAPALIDPGDPTPPWPVAERAAGRHGAGRRPGRRGSPTCRPAPGTSRRPQALRRAAPAARAARRPFGFLVAGAQPLPPARRRLPRLPRAASPASSPPASRGARAYEAERAARRGAAPSSTAPRPTFFTNVSHELRTPLTLLLGPAEDALADAAHPLAAGAARSASSWSSATPSGCSSWSTPCSTSRGWSPAGSTRRYEPVDLARYTAELAACSSRASDRAGLTLTVDCPPLAEPVYVDREMWAKIVLNLLSNALKFTFAGGITVRLRERDGRGRAAVTDTGIGIDAGRAGAACSSASTGSRRAARAATRAPASGWRWSPSWSALHGGGVAVTARPAPAAPSPSASRSAPRTCRRTRSPADADGDRRSRAPRPRASWPRRCAGWRSRPPDRTPRAGSRPSDRRPPARPRRRRQRRHARLRHRAARRRLRVSRPRRTARSALELARADPPDLVLTDVMMPRLDGFGLLAALRARPRDRGGPGGHALRPRGRGGHRRGPGGRRRRLPGQAVLARELLARVQRQPRARPGPPQPRDGSSAARRCSTRPQRLAQVGSWELDSRPARERPRPSSLASCWMTGRRSSRARRPRGVVAELRAPRRPSTRVRRRAGRGGRTARRSTSSCGVVRPDGERARLPRHRRARARRRGRPRASARQHPGHHRAARGRAGARRGGRARARRPRASTAIADELQRSLLPAARVRRRAPRGRRPTTGPASRAPRSAATGTT